MKHGTLNGRWIGLAIAVMALLILSAPLALAGDIGFENIYTDYQKMYSHFAPAGLHSDTENYKDMPLSKRHANCNDCHDPHSVMATPSPLGSYFGAGTQANVSGVRAFYTGVPAGGTPTYVFLSAVVKEYELCFKCHSGYSWGTQSLPKFNWTKGRYWIAGDPTSDVIVQETDTSVEFNPNNASYHPVIAKGKRLGSERYAWAGGVTFNQTFVPGRNANSLIKCSDCHGSDSTTVKGPHGSVNKYILKRRAPTQEPTTTVTTTLGSRRRAPKGSYTMTWYVRTSDVICYNCHDVKYYGPGKNHPSGGKHSPSCGPHIPVDLSYVGCATCKVSPIHGSPTSTYMMKGDWCSICHNPIPGQRLGEASFPSCPRFYSYEDDGGEVEETRVHFQSSRLKAGEEYFVPLPTPDMPNLKGLGNIPAYRYYNREDDYILFKNGIPKKTADNTYKVRFDQPSSGDRADGEPVGEVGYEDKLAIWTVDHAKDTQIYLSVDGDVLATKNIRTAKKVTDNLNNDLTSVINIRTKSTDDRSGWFQGNVGYGNTIDEIYKAGNSYIMDFGDLSQEKTIKLVWGVNEEKGGKLPILIQTKDEKGKWVTRGSARTSEDRYGFMDIKSFFPKGTRDFRVKIIPTLNSVDFMAVSTKDSAVKVTKLTLKRADYTKFGSEKVEDMTVRLASADKDYVPFDYMDNCDLYFDIPAASKTLPRRDFVFTPTGYYETGGDVHPAVTLEPMTAEKAQDFGVLTSAGGYANHYTVGVIDPGEWNERHGLR